VALRVPAFSTTKPAQKQGRHPCQIRVERRDQRQRRQSLRVDDVWRSLPNASTSTMIKYYFFGSQRVAMRVCTGANGSCGTNGATSTLSYLHGDHLGSASLSTNASGGKTAEMRYYPYGETRSGSMTTDRQYTGQRREIGLGLYDYNARYYDPLLGRFLSADSIVPSPANPQSLNRYSYVLNSPLRYMDPSGHKACDSFDASGKCIQEKDLFWVNFRGSWPDYYQVAVQEAAERIGTALAKILNDAPERIAGDPFFTPRQAFEMVYGKVTFWHVDQNPVIVTKNEDGTITKSIYWAETFTRNGKEVIEVNNWAFDATNYTYHNPAHELGHAFAHRTGGPDGYPKVPYDDLAASKILSGAYNPPGSWNQSWKNTSNENFADMFLGWAYYPFSPLGGRLNKWMNAEMPEWIALAVTTNQ